MGGTVQAWISVNGDNYLLCNLNKHKSQCKLNIRLCPQETIAFYVIGQGTVHIAGFVEDRVLDGLPNQE